MSFVLLPVAGAVVLAIVGAPALARVAPRASARALASVLMAVTSVAVPSAWLVMLSAIRHRGAFSSLTTDWASHLAPLPFPIAAGVGAVVSAWAFVGTLRLGNALRRHRALRVDGAGELVTVESEVRVRVLLARAPRAVVVASSGLQTLLDDEAFAFVVAHERAHGRHGHHRLLAAADACCGFLPPLRPVARHLEYQLERWADETAVIVTGCSRDVAARTIARVALASGPRPGLAPALALRGVAARAEALLAAPPRPSRAVRGVAVAVVAVVGGLATAQAHHLVGLVSHVWH